MQCLGEISERSPEVHKSSRYTLPRLDSKSPKVSDNAAVITRRKADYVSIKRWRMRELLQVQNITGSPSHSVRSRVFTPPAWSFTVKPHELPHPIYIYNQYLHTSYYKRGVNWIFFLSPVINFSLPAFQSGVCCSDLRRNFLRPVILSWRGVLKGKKKEIKLSAGKVTMDAFVCARK